MNAPVSPAAALEPDAAAIELFCRTVYRGLEGFAPIRLLAEKGGAPFRPRAIFAKAGAHLPGLLLKAARDANSRCCGLFAVPGVVAQPGRAKAGDITQMTAVLVDIDTGDIAAKRDHLVQFVGAPSLVVASGGRTAEGQEKLHLYWRLNAVVAADQVGLICRLRQTIAELAGGDPAFASAHQPIRVPGSIHAKYAISTSVRILQHDDVAYGLDELSERICEMPALAGLAPNGARKTTAAPCIRDLQIRPIREAGSDGITRHDATTRIIGHWLRQARLGIVTLEEAREAVLDYNAALIRPPWDEERLHREFGALQAVDARNRVAKGSPSVMGHAADAPADSPVVLIVPVPRSEDAIAASFVETRGSDWRFLPALGQWRRWDGTHWATDEIAAIREEVRQCCREAAVGMDAAPARRIASNRTFHAVQEIVSADPAIATAPGDWDREPMQLNTPGGILDLATGTVSAHDRSALMSRKTAASPGSGSPRWKTFLEQVTGGDDELIRYLARVCGYCLTGCTSEQVLFFIHGHGANGKSAFLSTVSAVMGSYATTASLDAFVASRSDRHPSDLAGLAGARLVTVTETEANRSWAESRIKAITGGEAISARFMYQDFFQYRPGFKLIIAGNHLPNLTGTGEAMRRRLHIVPFEVTIPAHERDLRLVDHLLGERDGVLGWMIEGCAEWQRLGLAPPRAVIAAGDSYFRDEDAVGQWIEARCEVGPAFSAPAFDLFASWKGWAEAHGHEPRSAKMFGEALRQRGLRSTRSAAGRGWQGIRLARKGRAS